MRSKVSAETQRSRTPGVHIYLRPLILLCNCLAGLSIVLGINHPLQTGAASIAPPSGLVAWWQGQSDAIDNAFVLPLYLGGVDLTPTNVVLTTETNALGFTWNVDWQIKNIGDRRYSFSSFDQVDEWVLSTSPDPADIFLSWPVIPRLESLGPGETAQMPTMHLSTLDLPLGHYYLSIVLKASSDLNSENNTLLIPVTPPRFELPDLTINPRGNLPIAAVPGETLTLTPTIENIGRGYALGAWSDRVSLSKAPTTDPTSVVARLENSPESRHLFWGASYRNTYYFRIPPNLSPGIYYLIEEVNYAGQLPEIDNRNNSMIIPIEVRVLNLPDVAVSDLRWIGVPSPAQPLEVLFRVTNVGPASADLKATWTDEFVLSASPDGSFPVAFWSASASRAFPRLASEEVVIKDWNVPVDLAGLYYLVATTYSREVLELPQNNNTQTLPIYIEKPDFIVSQLTWSGKAEAGEALSVSWRVENTGKGWASGIWPDRLVLSSSPKRTDAVRTWDFVSTNSVLPGGNYSLLQKPVELPVLPPGNYYMIAFADVFNRRPELSETNNSLVLPITLGGADLVATELQAGAESVAAGKDLAMSWNVRTAATHDYSGVWTDHVLLYSASATPEPLGSWEFSRHRTISTATGYSEHETIRLPAVPPGQYSLVLRTDSLNTIAESDEANNEVVIALTLTNLPPVVTLRPPINAPSLLSCLPSSVMLSTALEPGSYAVPRVDYYDAETLIGTALGTRVGSPVRSSVLDHGQHFLTARATDASGLVVTSAPVSLSIDRPPLNHLIAETAPDGSIVCCMGAEPGATYVAESTDGLVGHPVWSARWTNVPTDSLLIFTNRPDRSQQLFRIRIAP